MKIGGLIARTVPELHRMNWSQLLRAWSAATGWTNNKIYIHLLLVLACSSALFNLVLKFMGGNPIFVGLMFLLCLLLPVNIYFAIVFSNRRTQLRQFIEENWEELNR
jgi:hypothetical protein